MKQKDIFGQLTVFDIGERKYPYQYRFQRYIGQTVDLMIGAYGFHTLKRGKIVGISKYYTDVEIDGEVWVGTPYSLSPAE